MSRFKRLTSAIVGYYPGMNQRRLKKIVEGWNRDNGADSRKVENARKKRHRTLRERLRYQLERATVHIEEGKCSLPDVSYFLRNVGNISTERVDGLLEKVRAQKDRIFSRT